MQIRIKTLTGKEIEIDIDPTDEVSVRVCGQCTVTAAPSACRCTHAPSLARRAFFFVIRRAVNVLLTDSVR